jgi:PPOX class probable F420-dependent enzyme
MLSTEELPGNQPLLPQLYLERGECSYRKLNSIFVRKGCCMLDGTTAWGKHAQQRLQSTRIAWLTTVGGDGRPYTVPVGFVWEGQTVPLFSQPKKQKLRNIRKNPRVTLALDETNGGHDVVIVEGTAELIDDPQISMKLPAYVEKYGALIESRGWTPASMAAAYSQAIRVTPTKITVHVVP